MALNGVCRFGARDMSIGSASCGSVERSCARFAGTYRATSVGGQGCRGTGGVWFTAAASPGSTLATRREGLYLLRGGERHRVGLRFLPARLKRGVPRSGAARGDRRRGLNQLAARCGHAGAGLVKQAAAGCSECGSGSSPGGGELRGRRGRERTSCFRKTSPEIGRSENKRRQEGELSRETGIQAGTDLAGYVTDPWSSFSLESQFRLKVAGKALEMVRAASIAIVGAIAALGLVAPAQGAQTTPPHT